MHYPRGHLATAAGLVLWFVAGCGDGSSDVPFDPDGSSGSSTGDMSTTGTGDGGTTGTRDAGANGDGGTGSSGASSTTGDTTSSSGDAGLDAGCDDMDSDGVCDDEDACPGFDDTMDADSDGVPDGCDVCEDGDDAVDTDEDGTSDGCDADDDDDGVDDDADNCPQIANEDQANLDGDEQGDACDSDADGDDVEDDADNCPGVINPGQEDGDEDTRGDACDLCPEHDDFNEDDADEDTVPDVCDVCPGGDDTVDTDGDEIPNACDDDDDGDGVEDGDETSGDNCPLVPNGEAQADEPGVGNQSDLDGDGQGDACDPDADGDGADNGPDNCPWIANGEAQADEEGVGDQSDLDEDGVGDACDPDADGDGVDGAEDNCPWVANGEDEADVEGVGDQLDSDDDEVGDACDDDDDGDGVLDENDRCPGFDDEIDADGDGAPDACDVCEDSDDELDYDGDGVPDGCDACGPGRELGADASLWLRMSASDPLPSVIDAVTGDAVGSYGSGVSLGATGPSEDMDGAARLSGDDLESVIHLDSVAGFPTGSFTLAMWVQLDAIASEQTLLSYGTVGDADAVSIALADDGTAQGQVTVDGNTFTFPLDPPTRVWQHLSVRWNQEDGSLTVFAGGQPLPGGAGTLSAGAERATHGTLVLGQAQAEEGGALELVTGSALRGSLDEVAVFDQALPDDVIEGLATAFGGDCGQLPAHCGELVGAPLADGDGVYRVYPPSRSGEGLDVYCDMTTEGGGWTRCGRIDEELAEDASLCVEEGAAYLDAGSLTNASFCAVFFQELGPTGLMVHNRTTDSSEAAAGTDERVFVDWSEDPIALGDYDAQTEVTCYSTNPDGSTRHTYDDCRYVSHQNEAILEAQWQDAVWSFAAGLDNAYSDNYDRRVLLGPTFNECSGSGAHWGNFAGRSEPTGPFSISGAWHNNENVGDLYLR